MEAPLTPITPITNVQNDRRAHLRRSAVAAHGIVLTRIRPGDTATLIDVSRAGMLIETSRRLLPGTFVEVCLEGRTERANARALVLRCAVVDVQPAAMRYRGAIQFDSYLPWFVEDDEYVVHWGRTAGPAVRAEAAPQVV